MFFIRLSDAKTQPISAILKLRFLGYLLASLTISLAVRGDNNHLYPLTGKFTTIFIKVVNNSGAHCTCFSNFKI